jgi:hypothetical protein
MQGVMIFTPATCVINSLWSIARRIERANVSDVYSSSFSIEREEHFVGVRQELDPLAGLDKSEISQVRKVLGPGQINSFAIEYRMGGFGFVTQVLVSLLRAGPTCFMNDHDLIASGDLIMDAVLLHPSWDWRRASAFPA